MDIVLIPVLKSESHFLSVRILSSELHSNPHMVLFYLDETSGNCMGRSSFAGAHVGLSQICLMFISTNTECLQARFKKHS